MRTMDAGGVHENDLGIRQGQDAQLALARGLRPGGDCCHLLPQERIKQGGFAHIRPPDDRHKAGPGMLFF